MVTGRNPSRPSREVVQDVLRQADLLYSPGEVESAYERLARAITAVLADRDPLVLSVMVGGLVVAGKLLPRLDFPLEVDYIHATRYGGQTQGSELHWRAYPATPLEGRAVLVVDDILDEGLTLAAILDHCRAKGAREVYSAVLVEKCHQRKPAMQHADFTGVSVEDRYVFGCGMDYRGYLRNVSGIYAVKGRSR